MKLAIAVALGFSVKALADWGTCTSSTCKSATDGLFGGSGSTGWGADPTKAAVKSSLTSTATWDSWSADPTKSAAKSTWTSTGTWATWNADPTKSATNSSFTSTTTSGN